MKNLSLPILTIFAVCLVFAVNHEIKNTTDLQANTIIELTNKQIELTDYSEEQIRVIEEFGKPDEFIINLDDNGALTRYETWKYITLGKIFIFEGGSFINSFSYDFGINDDQQYIRAKISPKDVYDLKNIDDLDNLLGITPTKKGLIDENALAEGKYFDYGEVVSAVTEKDKLVLIETQSFLAYNQ